MNLSVIVDGFNPILVMALLMKSLLYPWLWFLGAEEKTNVELIVPIGCVVVAMFFWLLIVFVIRGRKRVLSRGTIN